MNNDELILALKQAEDRIKNLDYALEAQRQLLEKTTALNFMLQDKIMTYDQLLGEADGRLKKAMADFKHAITEGDPCEICLGYKEDSFECEAADCDCVKCQDEKCYCKDCRDMNKWKWRGEI